MFVSLHFFLISQKYWKLNLQVRCIILMKLFMTFKKNRLEFKNLQMIWDIYSNIYIYISNFTQLIHKVIFFLLYRNSKFLSITFSTINFNLHQYTYNEMQQFVWLGFVCISKIVRWEQRTEMKTMNCQKLVDVQPLLNFFFFFYSMYIV